MVATAPGSRLQSSGGGTAAGGVQILRRKATENDSKSRSNRGWQTSSMIGKSRFEEGKVGIIDHQTLLNQFNVLNARREQISREASVMLQRS